MNYRLWIGALGRSMINEGEDLQDSTRLYGLPHNSILCGIPYSLASRGLFLIDGMALTIPQWRTLALVRFTQEAASAS